MISATGLLPEIQAALRGRGLDDVEVFLKRGRSRRFELGPQGRIATSSNEEGWAVRASSGRASLFASGTGRPKAQGPWPQPDGQALRLPSPGATARWSPSEDLDSALLVENEAVALLEAVERELDREMPGTRLLRAVLDEGSSESEVANSLGIEASYRSRAALLEVRAVSSDGPFTAGCTVAEREARKFQPKALARRLADRLAVAAGKAASSRDRGELLLAPAVGAAVLEGLVPLLVGSPAAELARAWRDRQGRVAGPGLTVIDNGRYPGGVLEAPVDGEGVATAESVLIEEGVFRQSLLPWWETTPVRYRGGGCCRRAGWRDLPALGYSHLYLRPDRSLHTASLIETVARGYYLLEVLGRGRFDFEGDAFRLPVCGFALERGAAFEPVARAWLCGAITALLRGVQAAARDLVFFPRAGMVGSPTLLVTGLELRATP